MSSLFRFYAFLWTVSLSILCWILFDDCKNCYLYGRDPLRSEFRVHFTFRFRMESVIVLFFNDYPFTPLRSPFSICHTLMSIFCWISIFFTLNSNKLLAYLLFVEFSDVQEEHYCNICLANVRLNGWMGKLDVCVCATVRMYCVYYCVSAHAPNSIRCTRMVFWGFGCQNHYGMNEWMDECVSVLVCRCGCGCVCTRMCFMRSRHIQTFHVFELQSKAFFCKFNHFNLFLYELKLFFYTNTNINLFILLDTI